MTPRPTSFYLTIILIAIMFAVIIICGMYAPVRLVALPDIDTSSSPNGCDWCNSTDTLHSKIIKE